MDNGQHAAPSRPRYVQTIIDLAVFVALFFALQFVIGFAVKAYGVPSGSMESTIITGDRVVTERISYYFGDTKAGDIVTFEDPEIPDRTLLKRCIAVEGQTVDLIEGVVYVDGVALSEPYTLGKETVPLERTIGDITYPYLVPEGHIWVMGDNRTDSQDSRYFGAIPESSVYGRAVLVCWPLEHVGVLE